MTTKEENGWGGKRERAGRPPVDDRKKQITVTVPPALLAELDNLARMRDISRSEALALVLGDANWDRHRSLPHDGDAPQAPENSSDAR